MRATYLGAATLVLLLGGCGDLYSNHSGEAYRSNAGFTRENPPPVGPAVTGSAAVPAGPAHPSDVGANASQGAPTGGP